MKKKPHENSQENTALFTQRINRIDSTIIEALRNKTAFSFRINRHRAVRDEVIKLLHKEGFEPQGVTWSPDVFTLPIAHRKTIIKTQAYTRNMIYIQNLSSIFSALALGVKEEDWVLDLAAAPGGKSLIFSERACKVSAVEPDKHRFYRMKRNFKEHGAKNIQTYNKDGRFVYKATGAIFDRVFLDAPCSSEAHIDMGEGITWWNMKRVRRFSKLQKQLIVSAYEALKPAGVMIYATCTFAPEENEGVVNFLLERYRDAHIVPLQCPLSNTITPLTEWEGETFAQEVRRCVRLKPQGAYSGFFFAKIQKGGR